MLTPSSRPSLFQSLDFSPSNTAHLLSSLPLHHCFHFPWNKRTDISVSLIFSFLLASFHLGHCSARGLQPHLSSHHPSHFMRDRKKREAAKLISRGSWQPETMRWWDHYRDIQTYWATRQIPGLLVAIHDKRGLEKCLSEVSLIDN